MARILLIILNICLLSLAALAQSDDEDLRKNIIHISSKSDGGNMVQRVALGIKGGQDDPNERFSIGNKVDFSEAVRAQSGIMSNLAPYVFSRGHKRIRMRKVSSPIITDAEADAVADEDDVTNEVTAEQVQTQSSENATGNANHAIRTETMSNLRSSSSGNEKVFIKNNVDFAEAVKAQANIMNSLAPYIFSRGHKRLRAQNQVERPITWRPIESVTDFPTLTPVTVESYSDGVSRSVKEVQPQYEESNAAYVHDPDKGGITTNKHNHLIKKCDTTNHNTLKVWRQMIKLLGLDQNETKANAATLKKLMTVLKKVVELSKHPELDNWSREEVVQSIMSELMTIQSKISMIPNHKPHSIKKKPNVPESLMSLSSESDEKSSEDTSEELRNGIQHPNDMVTAEDNDDVTSERLASAETDADAEEPLKRTDAENNLLFVLKIISEHLKNYHRMSAHEVKNMLSKIMDKVVPRLLRDPINKCQENEYTKLVETVEAAVKEYLEAGNECASGRRFDLTNKHLEQMLAMPEMKAVMNEVTNHRQM